MSDRIRLGDDGTMDTVLVCRNCGAEARYNYDGPEPDYNVESPTVTSYLGRGNAYDDFVAWAIEDFDSDHECGEQD